MKMAVTISWKRGQVLTLWLLALPVWLSLPGCSGQTEQADTADTAVSQAVQVQVAKVEVTTLRPELTLVGTLIAIPERTAMISSQLGGWVTQLAVVEGQAVKAGDLLVQLDSRSARTNVDRATATVAEKEAVLSRLKRGYLPQEVEVARQDRDKAEATVDGLRTELVALDDLLERQEISPVVHVTKAKALAASEAVLAAAAAHLELLEKGTPVELIDEAQAQLDVAKADLKQAQLALEWCSIVSPIDGVVVQLLARQGQFLDRAAALATVIDLSQLFVQLRIPSSKFADVQPGASVDVQLDSVPGRTFHGSIERISGQADLMTGNVIVFALLDNSDALLRPGLSCRSCISLPEVPDALAVPVAAVADNSGTSVVTVIRDGKAYETVVETGTETHQMVQILKGLSAGDTVATSGGYGLPDGCEVEAVVDSEVSDPSGE